MEKHSRRCGFTLVELLVVIGIIALLISILLPSLARARRAAQTVACLSNIKQLGIAIQMYRNDNRQMYPYTTKDCWWINNDILAPAPYTGTTDRGCSGIDNGPGVDIGFWAQAMWCPHALGPYFGASPISLNPTPSEIIAPMAMACAGRHALGGYTTVTATGRKILNSMFMATAGHYSDGGNPNGTLRQYSKRFKSDVPWASGGLDRGGAYGSAIAACNTREPATMGWVPGHTTHHWGFCSNGRIFSTPHGTGECDENAPANMLMPDGSAKTVYGFVSPNL